MLYKTKQNKTKQTFSSLWSAVLHKLWRLLARLRLRCCLSYKTTSPRSTDSLVKINRILWPAQHRE